MRSHEVTCGQVGQVCGRKEFIYKADRRSWKVRGCDTLEHKGLCIIHVASTTQGKHKPLVATERDVLVFMGTHLVVLAWSCIKYLVQCSSATAPQRKRQSCPRPQALTAVLLPLLLTPVPSPTNRQNIKFAPPSLSRRRPLIVVGFCLRHRCFLGKGLGLSSTVRETFRLHLHLPRCRLIHIYAMHGVRISCVLRDKKILLQDYTSEQRVGWVHFGAKKTLSLHDKTSISISITSPH